MFRCFFPRPLWFFTSAIIWCALLLTIWYTTGEELGRWLGFPLPVGEQKPIVGIQYFVSAQFLWFDVFAFASIGLFYAFWQIVAPEKWIRWATLGSSMILFMSYLSVQFTVAANYWAGPFYNMVQKALTDSQGIPISSLYKNIFVILVIYVVGACFYTLNKFLISHFIFRWRTAMNDHYTSYWQTVRNIEGASQRVQEDTMRFATGMENLGYSLAEAILTLISFVPVLLVLSENINELPLLGEVPYPLLAASLTWALFGTGLMSLVGIRLPGLEFENQKVEAAYRKELVYGEDDPQRANRPTLLLLFKDIRTNYFRIYKHYLYFNVTQQSFLKAHWVFSLLILSPSIAAGTLTYGLYVQIDGAMWEVNQSFQYLIRSWPQVVDMLSVYKRLSQFEKSIDQTKP